DVCSISFTVFFRNSAVYVLNFCSFPAIKKCTSSKSLVKFFFNFTYFLGCSLSFDFPKTFALANYITTSP
ncbi:hypothetical protein, partial [Spiroplasma endosymbiont of Megaselia nigra]|uniref:hypothetical protein n=1 Tax=Spiroplasma endosymbiont of Megaselia nigra TaxID=2478537 RepID=UPI0013159AAD